MNGQQIARGLAWFGIGLGVAEVLAPRRVTRAAGLDGFEGLVAAFGWREIGAGLVVLAAADPQRWLWLRVAGDGLDGALLGSRLQQENPKRARTLLAALAVAPVVALDVLYAQRPAI